MEVTRLSPMLTPRGRTPGLYKVLDEVKAKVQSGNVDKAVTDTVNYIMSHTKTPEEKTELQNMFDNAMGGTYARGNFYQFCRDLANSVVLQQFKPDTTPPLFHPMHTGPLYAAADHRNTNLLEANFNRSSINEVTSPDFSLVSEKAKQNIRKVAPLSGKLLNSSGKVIGGCLRVNEDTIIMPLHCTQDVINGTIQFLSPDLQTSRTCHIASVLETYENIDIAVIQLREKQEPVNISYSDSTLDGEQLFLLHYPMSNTDEDLQISGHPCSLSSTWDGYSLVTAHDSSPGSSGGIYINHNGEIVGLHIGAYGKFKALAGAEKYAYRLAGLNAIVDSDSKIYDFLSPEGRKSQKDLANRLQAVGKLAGIPLNANGGVAFKVAGASVVQTLKNTYKVEFRATIKASLGVAGYHGETRQYSIDGEIESDHPLPCEVWRDTTNQKLKQFAPGVAGRPGQNKMPAMTIPENVHSRLRSTIDPAFRKQLVTLCNNCQIPDALKAIIDDQRNKGLLINNTPAGLVYKNGWKTMLDEFEVMGILTVAEKAIVAAHL